MTPPEFSDDLGLLPLLFRHHLWSNLRLCDSCLALTEEQLDWSDPGTYGSVRETLTHIVRAEEWYLSLLTGKSRPDDQRPYDQIPIAELKERAQKSGPALMVAAAAMQPGDQVEVGEGDELEVIPARIILLQAIHHAHEHRTQITTLLGQQGIQPTGLSGWRYHDEVMAPEQG